jgi:hypothetical protein
MADDIIATDAEGTIETTVEKAVEQGEQEPVRKTGHELPSVRKTGAEVGDNPNSTFGETMPDRETPVKRTSPIYTKPKGTSELPEGIEHQRPEPGKFHADPRTEGTPVDSPMFREQKKESLFTKVSEAPRRAKEKAEEIGYSATKAYHKSREVPAQEAAKERYENRMLENDIKFQKGEISSTIHKRRQMEYASEFDNEKKPIEQRAVNASIDVGNAFIAGLKHTQQKVEKDYRPSPAPKIKPSRGLDMSRVENIGVRPAARSTTHKGKKAEPAPKYQIDFGRSGSTIDFSGGYSLFGAKKKKR